MSARRTVTRRMLQVTRRMLPEVRSKSVIATTIGVARATLDAHWGAPALAATGERETRAC